MESGLIMEIAKKHVVVLTPQGDFIKVKRNTSNLMLGMEISFEIQTKKSFVDIFNSMKLPQFRMPVAMMTLAVMFIAFFVQPFSSNEVHAYMTLDINPSIEFEVNEDMEVVKIHAQNKDGKVIKSHMKHWKYEHISDVMKDVVRLSEKYGYLKGKKDVLICASIKDENNHEIKVLLERYIAEAEDDFKGLNVAAIYAPLEVREYALEQDMSTGKVALAMKMQEKGVTLTQNDIANKSVTELISMTGQNIIALIDSPVTTADLDNYKSNLLIQGSYAKVTEEKSSNGDSVRKPFILPKTYKQETPQVVLVDTRKNKGNSKSNRPVTETVKKEKPIKKPSNQTIPSKGKDKGDSNDTITVTPIDAPPIDEVTAPPLIDDEYIAGIDYDKPDNNGGNSSNDNSNNRPTPGQDDNEPEENADDGNESDEPPVENPPPNEQDAPEPVEPAIPDTDTGEESTPPLEEPNNSHTCENGYYYENEMILFFEVDENGNIVEVWKEIPIKKVCPHPSH